MITGGGSLLLVDDDPAMNCLLRDFLKRQGYDVTASTSVRGAMEHLARPGKPPDLVLSDINLGTATGIDLVRTLSFTHPGLPVVLFSVADELKRAALDSGAKRFLRMPFTLRDLATVLKEELSYKNK